MTSEEAKAYFQKCNENIVAVAKEENAYDYDNEEIMAVSMKEAYDANVVAIYALNELSKTRGLALVDDSE